MTFYQWLEVCRFDRCSRMLQVVHCPAIRDRGNQRTQLQRRHRNAFAEGTHLANSTQLGGDFLVRINSRLLTLNVITGKLAQSVCMRVVRDFFKSELTAQGLEICIV